MPNQSDRAAGPVAMGPWELGRNDSFVLSAVQALSRAIDRSVQAITMLVGDDTEGLRFRFWTTDHPIDLAIVAEDSANAFGSLTALLLADEDQYLHEEILVGPPPPDIDRWAGRLLYLTPPLAAAMPHLIPPTPITDSPDPDLTMTALDRENLHTLRAHQASLGHITPDMHAVALRTGEQELRLRVFAADPTGDTTTTHTTARIADRLARLLPSGHAPIVTELVPGLPPTDNRLRTLGRMIYWGKDLSPASRRIELLLATTTQVDSYLRRQDAADIAEIVDTGNVELAFDTLQQRLSESGARLPRNLTDLLAAVADEIQKNAFPR